MRFVTATPASLLENSFVKEVDERVGAGAPSQDMGRDRPQAEAAVVFRFDPTQFARGPPGTRVRRLLGRPLAMKKR